MYISMLQLPSLTRFYYTVVMNVACKQEPLNFPGLLILLRGRFVSRNLQQFWRKLSWLCTVIFRFWDWDWRKVGTCMCTSTTFQKAIIRHQQLSGAVGLYGVFLRTPESWQFPRGGGGGGLVVNRKIRRKKLADDQDIHIPTLNKGSNVWISKF